MDKSHQTSAAAPSLQEPQAHPKLSLRAALWILAVACVAFWGDVLLGGRVLLPGAMLRGFAPFGGDAQAPWTILHWDALAQYFPWRSFAAERLRSGAIPLWNPHQFSGAPFAANGQSAVFYPLSLPFWIFDTARAFGIAAFLHSMLAAGGAWLLLRRWQLSGGAVLLGALAWTFCGYLAAWNALPTLAHTASWLPLLLWLFERAADPTNPSEPRSDGSLRRRSSARIAWFALVLCCALLAGHAQVFAFLVGALAWRALTLESTRRALQVLGAAGIWAAALGALQLLPTLELARLGHRAGAVASENGWAEAAARALQPTELFALAAPGWPMGWGTLNENFPYVGAATLLLSIVGVLGVARARRWKSPQTFALGLVILGLGTALAWPVARWIYFGVPGAAQLGGFGRALLLWSLGVAMLAAFGLDSLAKRWPQRATLLVLLACGAATLELGLNGWGLRATSTREEIYPQTALTSWLKTNLTQGERVLFVTPRRSWLPAENLAPNGRAHPPGVLPLNGAMVYGLDDVGGYDSLSPRAYREFLNGGEGVDVAPLLNGNIALPAASNARLDELNVRYIVALSGESVMGQRAFESEGCVVWRRDPKASGRRDGRDFSPGWRDGQYQPQSFRLGAFLSLCALAGLSAALCPRSRARDA